MIGENELPFSVPNVDHAWEEMRKLLDEDRPEVAPVLPLNKPGFSALLKYFSGAAILLLIFSVAYLIIRPSGNNNSTAEKIVDASVKPGNIPVDTLGNSTQSDNGSFTSDQDRELSADNVTGKKEEMNTAESAGSLFQTDNNRRMIAGKNSHSSGKKVTMQSDQNKMPASIALNNKDALSNKENPEKSIRDISESHSPAASAPIDAASDRDSSNAKMEMAENDSTAAASDNVAPHIELPAEKWTINTGLQWTVPAPLNGGSNYFIGPNGQSQPYRLLLPGAWLQAEKEKQLITFDINPFAVSLPPAKAFRTITSVENVQDTLVQTTDQRTLVKTFGLSAGVTYQYKIFSNWWAGGGVQMLFWKRAVAGSAAAINKIPMGGTAGVTTNQQSIYKVTDEWSYFSKIQASISTEIFYKAPKWQAGFRLGVPITPLAQQDGPKYFLRGELIYRLHLTRIHLDK
jgi:hypothetical protein